MFLIIFLWATSHSPTKYVDCADVSKFIESCTTLPQVQDRGLFEKQLSQLGAISTFVDEEKIKFLQGYFPDIELTQKDLEEFSSEFLLLISFWGEQRNLDDIDKLSETNVLQSWFETLRVVLKNNPYIHSVADFA